MQVLPFLERKRDGGALTAEEIAALVAGFTSGRVPDYQMAAWLMAALCRGLDPAETRALTLAMRDSGVVLRWPDDPRPVVDKHSTGGVGDKVSLPLVPLLMALGFRVPMISGRGLGITGGTLDKLESIPGFSTRLTPDRLVGQVQEIGGAMAGQTEDLVPADRRLYALRDATGTVPSIPLITASILSKKLAEGLAALVLDVKFGPAAFMPDAARAAELARAMVGLGNACGTKSVAFLSPMHAPLGHAVGNWLEVQESHEILTGAGPADVRALVVECASRLLYATGRAVSLEAGRARASDELMTGRPLACWRSLLTAQGADLAAYDERITRDIHVLGVGELRAQTGGFVRRCDARVFGEVVRELGGGRFRQEDVVDGLVGIDRIVAVGAEVRRGEVLARVHGTAAAAVENALERLGGALEIGPVPPEFTPLVCEVTAG
ncbi:MAG: thymidine phosphorylase [Limisphaerales bacterium]